MDSAAERQKPKPKTKTVPFRHSQTSEVGFDSHRPLQIVAFTARSLSNGGRR
jgi:hypothetical protein